MDCTLLPAHRSCRDDPHPALPHRERDEEPTSLVGDSQRNVALFNVGVPRVHLAERVVQQDLLGFGRRYPVFQLRLPPVGALPVEASEAAHGRAESASTGSTSSAAAAPSTACESSFSTAAPGRPVADRRQPMEVTAWPRTRSTSRST